MDIIVGTVSFHASGQQTGYSGIACCSSAEIAACVNSALTLSRMAESQFNWEMADIGATTRKYTRIEFDDTHEQNLVFLHVPLLLKPSESCHLLSAVALLPGYLVVRRHSSSLACGFCPFGPQIVTLNFTRMADWSIDAHEEVIREDQSILLKRQDVTVPRLSHIFKVS